MHVDHELVEFMHVDKQDYEEVIEEYKEAILVQEGALEPFGADFVDPPPAQGKPWCITPIFEWLLNIYDVHLCYRYFMETTCINISTYESY